MALLLGLLSYLIAAVAIVGGAAAFLSSAFEPAVTLVPAQQDARKVAPRVQPRRDRKAEGRVHAQKEKAAAFAEKKRAEARRLKTPSTAELAAFARMRDNEEKQAAGRESATRMKDSVKREAERRSRELRDPGRSGPPLAYYPDLHGRSQ